MNPDNKKILFLSPNFPEPGGIEMVTRMLTEFFSSQGYETFILSMKKEAVWVDSVHGTVPIVVSMPGTLNDAENRAFIWKFIRENDIPTVINQGAFSSFYKDKGSSCKTNIINTLHGKPFWETDAVMHATFSMLLDEQAGAWQKIKCLLRKTLVHLNPEFAFPNLYKEYKTQIEEATRYVVLDPSFKRLLEDTLYHGVPQPHILSIENPLSGKPQPVGNKSKSVLFVGRLIRSSKRVDRLLNIWKCVAPLHPDWTLTIVGDGPDKTRLLGLAKHLERVEFTGFQPASSYYEQASILCLTSSFEGMPLVVTEAQQYGTVPIVYDCSPAIGNLIENEVDGIIVPAFKQKQFVCQLDKMMSDSKYLNNLSLNAHQSYSKKNRNQPTDVGNKWLALLEELERDACNSPKSATTQTFVKKL